mmetsp:Transcript_24873/g.36500  ORF Transcript_24873/g.36500 Transcript_24873/m.36500 type:complete len:203 (-) Transcript_24873:141-749(-)|eukprot:CAMPEP_0195514340 /NCGR_PEP_ID=MMETSP0794_2-20130614/5759_1 /TAXON_ID=515487 /ORGANISM="Stephanopyxis turris, Strain CCMP 815" /LENGTH=202 /DNA_ID=CAMNT_0040642563 /DNA_START=99 /DNA_END=707 /DNA_ORIENTATION=-
MSAAKRIKIVAIGDGNVGKTSMLISYSTGEIPEDYVPTVFDNFRTQINTSHGEITLDIWDTAGQEEYAEIRKLAFNNVDVFLVCFSIGNPTSLENLESKWINDVAESESPGAKVIICGTKNDLRFDTDVIERLKESGSEPVTAARGEAAAQRAKKTVDVAGYAECSALTGTGLKDIFTLAVNVGIKAQQDAARQNNKKCVIL